MDFGELDRIIAGASAERVVEVLTPFLSEVRRERIEQVLAGRLESLHVAVERPEDPHNAAAIVRSAEAFGVLNVHAIEAPSGALHAPATTQGSFYWVHTYHHPTRAAFLERVRAEGLVLAGASMDGALSVEELPVDGRLCVVFGNEKVGLSEELVGACALTFRIPMVGMSESLNLSVSAAITLYGAARARRQVLATASDLSGERLMLERARYYARSVELRLLEGLFG